MSKFTDCRRQVWRQGEQIVQPCFSSVLELRGGVCYGTCVEWLKRLRLRPQEGVANRLQHLNDQGKLIGGRQRVYQSARDALSSQLGGNFTAAAHFQLMSSLLSVGSFDMSYEFLDGGNFTEMPDVVAALIGQVDYLLVNVSLLNCGHAIAMRVGATSRLFDPNFGEFEIPQADLNAFFDAYFLVTAMTGAAYLMVNLAAVRFG